MPPKTDEEIVDLVQKGDAESFGFLMDRYEKRLLRYGTKYFADREDVKDLVQEAFIKAYVNIRSFDVSRRFSPWIYRIAHNEFVNAMKKKSRETASSFDLDLIFPHPVAEEAADDEAHRADERRMIDECLQRLDAKYREPLILYYFEELDYQQISDVLQIPVSTVGVRLKRAKDRVRELVSTVDATYERHE